jgi:DNA polymerase-3 subunit gamma/tau
MTSQVFYRKWRPQSFAEVAGQDHVIQTLRNAIKRGRIAHAYLFCGPRGSGKTSTARILAKAFNCRSPVEGEPCNGCDSCLSINRGAALDIIEIDEASNRGIDDMNELKERVNYSPNMLKYKVYIIDEVHMITREGANAFLKTLEEPPPHVIFILATTDPHKIISTITSRCQRYDFHRLAGSAVISRLAYICEQEGVQADPEALKLIARVSTGSLRDATNLLEQLITSGGDVISLKQAQFMLGISGDLRIRDLAGHIISRDIAGGLKVINAVASDGLDLRQFNRELVDYLRQLLLVQSGSAEMVDATSDDLAEMQKLAGSVGLEYLLHAVKLFSNIDLRLDSYSPLPLELALVESALSANHRENSPAAAASSGNNWSSSRPSPARPSEAARPPAVPRPPVVSERQAQERPAAEPAQPVVEQRGLTERLQMDDSGDVAFMRGHWKEFINSMKGEGSNGNMDARLRHACEPVEIKDGTLVLGFYHQWHLDYINNRKYLHLIERKLLDVFGHNYTISCMLKQPDASPKPKAPEETFDLAAHAQTTYGAVPARENTTTEEK